MSVSTDEARKTSAARVALMTFAAAAIYGSWAWLANTSHGPVAAARAGAIQAASSAFTTLVISGVIEKLFARLRPSAFRVPLAAGIAASCTATLHLGVHLLNGTPRIVATVLPSILLGYVFAGSYASALQLTTSRAERKRQASSASRVATSSPSCEEP